MKSLLLNNLGLKILSVILATLVWWLINNKINQPPESIPAIPLRHSEVKSS